MRVIICGPTRNGRCDDLRLSIARAKRYDFLECHVEERGYAELEVGCRRFP